MSLFSVPNNTQDVWKSYLKMKGKELAQVAHNAYILIKYHPDYRGCFRWNRVTLRVEMRNNASGGPFHCVNPDDLDEVITGMQDHLVSVHDLSLGRDDVGRRIVKVAQEDYNFDPIQDYLNSLVWDHEPRLDNWLTTYAEAEMDDDGYASIVGRKWLLSCVARAYHLGCKADVVLVAEGMQGAHKSTMLKILGGDWFCEAAGVLGDKDSKLLIGTAWICELPDMASFTRTGRDAMKAFFSMAADRYRPPYGRVSITVLRRVVFGATTNEEEYLTDPTGSRRFLPVHLGTISRAELIRDRDQIFAEAVAVYKAVDTCPACMSAAEVVPGERGRCAEHAWWLSPEQRDIAKDHAQHREEMDSWTPDVLKFALTKKASVMGAAVNGPELPLTTRNVLVHALDFKVQDIERKDEMRVAAILKRNGYSRPRRGVDTAWLKDTDDTPPPPPAPAPTPATSSTCTPAPTPHQAQLSSL